VRRWLDEPGLRRRLRSAALARRATLPGWSATAAIVADVLVDALAGSAPTSKAGSRA
jgi:hypothetical protein